MLRFMNVARTRAMHHALTTTDLANGGNRGCLVAPKARRPTIGVFAGRGLTELRRLREEEESRDDKREPLKKGTVSPPLRVPGHIPRPPYAATGLLPSLAREPEIHNAEGIERMRESGKLAAKALDYAVSLVKAGVSTDSIDKKVHQMIIDNGAYPSPLNYGSFPKSICTSVNECVCHGIPDSRILRNGDLLNIDITVYLNGYHGDTSRMVFVGEMPESTKLLVEANKRALEEAISICGPGVPFRKIGDKITDVAENTGFRVVKDFVGHGVGRQFHAAPYVFHHRNREPGNMNVHQTFTIEPIFTQGKPGHRQWSDGWTEVAIDGALSVQCEHSIIITPDGHEILTLS